MRSCAVHPYPPSEQYQFLLAQPSMHDEMEAELICQSGAMLFGVSLKVSSISEAVYGKLGLNSHASTFSHYPPPGAFIPSLSSREAETDTVASYLRYSKFSTVRGYPVLGAEMTGAC